MVSGVGPSATLENLQIPVVMDLPGVGQNMWDHVFFGPSYRVNFNTLTKVVHNPVYFADQLVRYALEREGPLANALELLAWEKLPLQARSTFSTRTKMELSSFPDDWPEVEPSNLQIIINPPIIDPNWLTTDTDIEVAIALYKRIRHIWQKTPMKSAIIGEEYFPGPEVQSDEDIIRIIRDTLMTVWHASCTCKMGTRDDPLAVVDSQARVFGLNRLRVVDASAFPLLPPGHPQSTVCIYAG
ncbi:hypothetical protein BBP40_008549 [Aspergillus hancockii]|nr:hypothetical protein BBP40_008549 [Aspergillus hancockii]